MSNKYLSILDKCIQLIDIFLQMLKRFNTMFIRSLNFHKLRFLKVQRETLYFLSYKLYFCLCLRKKRFETERFLHRCLFNFQLQTRNFSVFVCTFTLKKNTYLAITDCCHDSHVVTPEHFELFFPFATALAQ